MTDREFDKLLEKSVKEFGNEYFDNPQDDTLHTFSKEFDNQVLSAASKDKKKQPLQFRRFIKVFSAAAAVFVIAVGAYVIIENGIFPDSGSSSNNTNLISSEKNAAASAPYQFSETSEDTADSPAYDHAEEDNPPAITNNADDNMYLPDNNASSGSKDDISQSTNTSRFGVTVKKQGKYVTLSEDKLNLMIETAKELVSNDQLIIDLTMSSEEFNSFKEEGIVITIVRSDGRLIEINGYDVGFSEIEIMLKDNAGYAAAYYENGALLYYIQAAPDVYELFNNLTE